MTDRNRDYRPEEGQQSNQNWDDNNDQNTNREQSFQNTDNKGNARVIDDQLNSSGIGSSQRRDDGNVGPLDSDLEDLPSHKRIDRNNQTGPGLG